MSDNVYLIGFMGTGKSTTARYLGVRLGFPVMDLDAEIEREEQSSIKEIFAGKGEAAFRDLESERLAFVASGRRQVIACGGGIVLRDGNIRIMKDSGKVILLKASSETLLKRVSHDKSRPLLEGRMSKESLERLMKERVVFYKRAADMEITTDGRSLEEITGEIAEKLSFLGIEP